MFTRRFCTVLISCCTNKANIAHNAVFKKKKNTHTKRIGFFLTPMDSICLQNLWLLKYISFSKLVYIILSYHSSRVSNPYSNIYLITKIIIFEKPLLHIFIRFTEILFRRMTFYVIFQEFYEEIYARGIRQKFGT